jgi:hypothetical protein
MAAQEVTQAVIPASSEHRAFHDRALRPRSGQLLLAAILALAGCASQPDPRVFTVEPREFRAEVVGEWWDLEASSTAPYFIALQPDGAFLAGVYETFGLYPTSWRIARIHLPYRDALLVRWPSGDTCAYYVSFVYGEGGNPDMRWRNDVPDVDLGTYDGVITRALAPAGPCRARSWRRLQADTPIASVADATTSSQSSLNAARSQQ